MKNINAFEFADEGNQPDEPYFSVGAASFSYYPSDAIARIAVALERIAVVLERAFPVGTEERQADEQV